MIYEPHKITGDNQDIAKEAGGIEAVVKAMSIHINSISVNLYGCRVLLNMMNEERKQSKFITLFPVQNMYF